MHLLNDELILDTQHLTHTFPRTQQAMAAAMFAFQLVFNAIDHLLDIVIAGLNANFGRLSSTYMC
jgi:hypothetical protein